MKFDLRKKPARLALAAAVVMVPLLAFVAGSRFGTDGPTQVATPAAAATPPVVPAIIKAPVVPAIIKAPELPQPLVRTLQIENGDNLVDVLIKAGAERTDAYTVIESLKGIYDPRRDLRVGDELRVTLGPVTDAINDDAREKDGTAPPGFELSSLRLPVAYDREVEVARATGEDFVAREIEVPLTTELVRASGVIDSSLFVNGRDAGIPIPVLIELIRIYSFDVDFQRDIWNGDAFEIMFERQRNENNAVVNNGDIRYAKLTLRGTELPLYRFETSKGVIDYFNEKGESVRKALMKTPLDGARLSSRFGNRKNPITGYTRLHAGADFAAPRGTPVYAAGDGTVQMARTNGSFGKYVRIRHNGTYSTAYAHLNGIARGIVAGKRVRQGQVIAYVGSTGRSTGPHLHYEIHRDGKQINPLGLKLPSGEKLKGDRLVAFQSLRESVDARYASLAAPALAVTADRTLTD